MCTDKATTFLQGLGYNTVRLPREGIVPMQIIARRSKGGSILGDVSSFIAKSDAERPSIQMNKTAAEINGKLSSDFKLDIGLGVLDAILKGFGLSGMKLGFAFKKATTISFKFKNVFEDSVDAALIGNYLQACSPRLNSMLIHSIDESGEAAILTSILKSNSFEVIAKDSKGATVEADVDGIKGVLDVSGKVNTERTSERTVSFTGDKHLTFGFKGFLFWIDLTEGAFRIAPPSGGDGNVGPLLVGGKPSKALLFSKTGPVIIDNAPDMQERDDAPAMESGHSITHTFTHTFTHHLP